MKCPEIEMFKIQFWWGGGGSALGVCFDLVEDPGSIPRTGMVAANHL